MPKYALTYERVVDLSTQLIIKFQYGLEEYKPVYKDIVPTFQSNTRANTYPIGRVPAVKEWFDEREIKEMDETHYTVVNRKFESTLVLNREDIEDDQTGFYNYQAEALGKEAAQHPDHLLAEVIKKGFTKDGLGYDKAPFFSDAHEWGTSSSTLSNFQSGTEEPWILMDSSKSVPAFFFQERVPYTMEKPADLSEYTFMKDKYLFGIRGRSAMGYGLWQFAFGSKAELNEDNFINALQKMMMLKKANDNFIGAYPTVLLVGPQNYIKAKKLIERETIDGNTNLWLNAVKIQLLLGLTKDEVVTTPPTETKASVRNRAKKEANINTEEGINTEAAQDNK